jgi:hypothetical protein
MTLFLLSSFAKCAIIISYAVYEPVPVNLTIVSLPLVVTVGEPVVVPEYLDVSILNMTTPD